jgi:hypothetical protein
VRSAGSGNQMKVIAQERVGMDFQQVANTDDPQCGEEELEISPGVKDVDPIVATLNDVLSDAWDLNSWMTSHAAMQCTNRVRHLFLEIGRI